MLCYKGTRRDVKELSRRVNKHYWRRCLTGQEKDKLVKQARRTLIQ